MRKLYTRSLCSEYYGSVNSKNAYPPPGICHGKERLQMPHGGGRAVHTNPNVELKTRPQMPYPGATPCSHQATNAILKEICVII